MAQRTADEVFRGEFALKLYKCAVRSCGREFQKQRMGQKVCGPVCALEIARAKREHAETKKRQEERKKDRERREELMPLSYFHKQTQKAVNAYIRARDADEPCISCGVAWAAQWDAGHFISRGADSALRYDFANIHKQCSVCNQHRAGNLLLYRRNLIPKIGEPEVLRLEGPQPVHKWTRDELNEIKRLANQLAKQLEKAEA